jgi:NitT/TauT family transport system permease protein
MSGVIGSAANEAGAGFMPAAAPRADSRTGAVLLPLGFALLVLAAWEFGVRLGHVPTVILPPPSDILAAAWTDRAILLRHAVPTTLESAAGFLLATLFGVAIAVLITWSRAARQALYPNLVFFQLIPKIALAPLFLVWFGIGSPSRLAFAVFIAFFPIVIATASGLMNVDRNMIRLCRSLTGTEWQIFLHVRFPAAVPYLFGGMKIGVTLAIIGVVIGEFITAQAGLGYLIIFATARADTAVALAAILVLCVCGLGLFGLVAVAEHFAARRFGNT